MGIDYAIDLGCPPKQRLSTPEIMALVKSRSRAEAVVELARAHGDERPPAEFTFAVVVETLDGIEEREVSAQELFDVARPLDEHAHHCVGCPANLGGEAGSVYGCCGYLAYPIPGAVEEWLLSLLPERLGSTAGQFLVRALADFEWDGSHAAGLRAREGTFLESRDRFVRRWSTADGELEVTSDQGFDMVFGVGHIQAPHAVLLCLLFGVLPHELPMDELQEAFADPARMAALLRRARLPSPPPQGDGGMLRFLDALRTTAALGVTLLLDG